MIICKFAKNALPVVSANPQMSWQVNVGNCGFAPGRETYADTVHLDADDYAAVREMLGMDNVDIFMQTVPSQSVNRF